MVMANGIHRDWSDSRQRNGVLQEESQEKAMNKILLIKLMLVIGFMVLVTLASALATEGVSAESMPAVVQSCGPDLGTGMI